MRAKNLTEPKKTKCACGADLPNTSFAPPVKSVETNKEVCADCKLAEVLSIFYAK